MEEELTTEMHYEFLEDMGVDKKDYMIFAASGMMKRTGCSKEEACKRYGISVEEYDANIDRVLNTDDWWGKVNTKSSPKQKEIYYENYEADAVVRVDEYGNRHIKTLENLQEQDVLECCKEAYGIPSYGIFNELKPITREEYENFGITWDWNPIGGKKRQLPVK